MSNIITKTLGCITVRAALSALADTKATNTIVMMAAETAAKEHDINCHTCHTSTGMQLVVGSEESVEVTIRISNAAKKAIVSKALETIEESGVNKEQLRKALFQAVLEQIKK